jgi:hypothetical protein
MAVAVMKKKTRRKLSKQLDKLIKLHGAEMALVLVTGIVSALAAERKNKADKKRKSAKSGKAAKPAKAAKAGPPAKAEKAAKAPVKAGAGRKRA